MSEEAPLSVAEQHSDGKEPSFKCRHAVALMSFGTVFFLGAHRMNMGVSIVAMVNNSAPLKYANKTSESCVSEFSEYNSSLNVDIIKQDGEFNWSAEMQGYIMSCSFFGYFFSQIFGGKLLEIFGCKLIVISGLFLSSACTFVTPFAAWWNVNLLITVQTVRGLSQGIFFPCASVLMANWLPTIERGFFFPLVHSGHSVGGLVGGLVSGFLCDSSFLGGWPSGFYLFGALGIILSLFMILLLYDSPRKHPRITSAEMKFILKNIDTKHSKKRSSTPWCKILTSVPVYAVSFAFFGQLWAGIFFFTVYPTFLATILHFPILQNGIYSSLPFILQAAFAFCASWLSSVISKRNWIGIDKLRKFCNFTSCLGCSLCFAGMHFAQCNIQLSILFAVLLVGFFGFGFAGSMIVPADMSPTYAGTLMSIASSAGSTAMFIFPGVVGLLTKDMQTLEQWAKVFYISIGVVMSSGIVFIVFGSAEVQPWNFPEEHVSEDCMENLTDVKMCNNENDTENANTDL